MSTSLPLTNPANDARAIEKLLEDLGFEVTGVTDRDAKKLRRDLERFAEDAEGPMWRWSIIPATASRRAAKTGWCPSMPISASLDDVGERWCR